ncbi:replication initiation protein [Shewanella sp. A32]|uniref:replication initiation protein n=1 Tax=Shewanella sp. A32 TaxID=3031327 RepID=UPI0023BA3A85|nr:replication initiation protein [Shewanella sp. A32]MDF0536060.1 replication initiation protein [Shewanella sp. A32]
MAPYVFDLREKYYSFHLSELSRIKSKYTLILMKMYQAQKMGNQKTVTITGEMNDWQDWFLGVDRSSNWTAGRFKQKVLNVAVDELIETLNVTIVLNTIKKGVKVTGYEITINSD